jgi:hypothetical protein
MILELLMAASAAMAADQGNTPMENDPNNPNAGATPPGQVAPPVEAHPTTEGQQAQPQAGGETTETGGQQQKMSATDMSPKDVCKHLVDASKSQAQLKKELSQFAVHGGKASKAEISAIQQNMTDASCSSETVAANHAVVVSKSPTGERLIPFVQQQGVWKVDLSSYQAIYQHEMRMPASKKKKK